MGAKQKQSKKPEAVKVEEVKTFDQRTNAVQPFINSEGKQVNGSEDIEVGPTEPQIVSPKENDNISEQHSFSTKVFRHTHVFWAVIAQFFYVGAQVCVGSFFIRLC